MGGRRIRLARRGMGALALAAALLPAGGVMARAADPFAAMNAARAVREAQAPPFKLQTLEGKPRALEDLQGKVVIFYYWRTW